MLRKLNKSIIILYLALTCFCSYAETTSRFSSGLIDGSLLSEQQCLTEVLWYEARGSTKQEKRAIIDVVLNRRGTPRYWSKNATKSDVDAFSGTICKIVWSSKQFSYRNHLKYRQRVEISIKNSLEQKALAEIKELVQNTLKVDRKGRIIYSKQSSLQPQVLHYATKSTKNFWTRKMKEINIQSKGSGKNLHKFYIASN